MNSIAFPYHCLTALRAELLQGSMESCALLICAPARAVGGRNRLLVREIISVPQDGYSSRTGISAQIKPEFYIPILKRARAENGSVTFVHTHPFSADPVVFSAVDNEGERILLEFLNSRSLSGPHAALVLGPSSHNARLLGTDILLQVDHIGPRIISYLAENSPSLVDYRVFDRQVRAFGVDGQQILSKLKAAIVGLGGTGAIVAHQLAYLGVSDFVLIDPDIVDSTNLNRLSGAAPNDLGRAKVEVAAENIRKIRPESLIKTIQADVLERGISEQILDCNVCFSCTDTHGSRALLNQIAYQYYIPCIDIGVALKASGEVVTHITGRVQMLSPGLACLTCASILDSDAIRRDFMAEEHVKADPYFIGSGEPQPAVISINSTLSSLAVTMFLGAFTAVPASARFQVYDGKAGTLRSVMVQPQDRCVICSFHGALGRGDTWELPARSK